MFNSYLAFIAFRYARAKKHSQFLSFISWFCLLGMTLGVASLVLVLSVMNGFEDELKSRLLHALPHGHVQVQPDQPWLPLMKSLDRQEGVVGVAPYIEGTAMLNAPGIVRGVKLTGIDVALEKSVSLIDDFMVAGQLNDLEETRYGIVLGRIMARQLGVWIGDKITVVLPQVSITPAGVFPRMKRFTVTGVFEVGAQIDHTDAFITLQDAAKIYRKGQEVDGLRIQTTDIYESTHIFSNLQNDFKDLNIRDWTESQGSLFQAIKMEKIMVSLLLMIVVLVAAFNIVSLLSMMVADKNTEIAVLRTMGMSDKGVMTVFFLQGSFIGGAGTFIGAIIGLIAAVGIADGVKWFESTFNMQVFDPNVYFISTLPSKILVSDVIIIVLGALAVSALATLYPAYQASKIAPAEALRYG